MLPNSRTFLNYLSAFIVATLWVTSYALDYTLVGDAAWCWFADPRSVYYHNLNERTYYGWMTASGDVNVAQYDHATRETKYSTLRNNLEIDDHDNPSILIRASDRRVIVFYS